MATFRVIMIDVQRRGKVKSTVAGGFATRKLAEEFRDREVRPGLGRGTTLGVEQERGQPREQVIGPVPKDKPRADIKEVRIKALRLAQKNKQIQAAREKGGVRGRVELQKFLKERDVISRLTPQQIREAGQPKPKAITAQEIREETSVSLLKRQGFKNVKVKDGIVTGTKDGRKTTIDLISGRTTQTPISATVDLSQTRFETERKRLKVLSQLREPQDVSGISRVSIRGQPDSVSILQPSKVSEGQAERFRRAKELERVLSLKFDPGLKRIENLSNLITQPIRTFLGNPRPLESRGFVGKAATSGTSLLLGLPFIAAKEIPTTTAQLFAIGEASIRKGTRQTVKRAVRPSASETLKLLTTPEFIGATIAGSLIPFAKVPKRQPRIEIEAIKTEITSKTTPAGKTISIGPSEFAAQVGKQRITGRGLGQVQVIGETKTAGVFIAELRGKGIGDVKVKTATKGKIIPTSSGSRLLALSESVIQKGKTITIEKAITGAKVVKIAEKGGLPTFVAASSDITSAVRGVLTPSKVRAGVIVQRASVQGVDVFGLLEKGIQPRF